MALAQPVQSDIILSLFTGIYVLASIIIPKILKEKGILSKYVARKMIHSFSGLAIFIAPYLNYPIIAAFLSLIMTILTRESKKKSKTKPLRDLFNAISEDEELEVGYLQGPFAYCLAITILMFIFTLFPQRYYYPIAAILIMMFADTAASTVGRKYGKHYINVPWVGSKRTVEGSITFFIVALGVSFLSYGFFGNLLPGFSVVLTFPQILLLSLISSMLSTLLELISPSKYDDLIIPLGTTLLISLLAILMQIW